MKPAVLHVISSTQRRGAETFACQLSEAFQQLGHRSDVVALVGSKTDEPLDVAALGADRRHPGTLRELRCRARDADVVIAHGGATLEACALGLAGTGTPFIYRVISDPRYWIDSRAKRLVLSRLHRRADHHVVLAELIIPFLVDRVGVRAERISVIPNGVPADRFPRAIREQKVQSREKLGVPVGERVVAFVGALSPEKDVGAALDLVAARQELHLLIAGSGPQQPLVQAAQRTHAGERIHYLGARSDVWTVYAAADVLLLPSRTEMMPAAAIEAAMVGTAILACDVGALDEMVANGLPAVLVPSACSSDLNIGIERVFALLDMGMLDFSEVMGTYELGGVAELWSQLASSLG